MRTFSPRREALEALMPRLIFSDLLLRQRRVTAYRLQKPGATMTVGMVELIQVQAVPFHL
jgi:hypothetical protein